MMKTISWNCKGLGSRKKKRTKKENILKVKSQIKKGKPLILPLKETKMGGQEVLQKCRSLQRDWGGQEISFMRCLKGSLTLQSYLSYHLLSIASYPHWPAIRLLHIPSSQKICSNLNIYMPIISHETISCQSSLLDLEDRSSL